MKTLALASKTEEELGILQIEGKMRELGLRIEGYSLSIVVKGTSYNIGRNQDCFPREVVEPLWRET